MSRELKTRRDFCHRFFNGIVCLAAEIGAPKRDPNAKITLRGKAGEWNIKSFKISSKTVPK